MNQLEKLYELAEAAIRHEGSTEGLMDSVARLMEFKDACTPELIISLRYRLAAAERLLNLPSKSFNSCDDGPLGNRKAFSQQKEIK